MAVLALGDLGGEWFSLNGSSAVISRVASQKLLLSRCARHHHIVGLHVGRPAQLAEKKLATNGALSAAELGAAREEEGKTESEKS